MLRRAAAAVFRLLESVRLAVALIIIILLLSLLSTFVPQGMEASFYRERFSPAAADLILASRFDRFFSSALFMIPAAAFAVNLAACTAGRMVRRRRVRPRRYGPDLLHIGLLALMAGGLLTFSLRTQRLYILAEGDEAVVSPRYSVKLESFEYTTYDSGAPKSWVSTVRVREEGAAARPQARIKVNSPLRLHGVTLYQASFSAEGTIHLRDSGGGTFDVETGGAFLEGDAAWYAAGVEKGASGWAALFIKVLGDREAGRVKAAPGDPVGGFTVEGIEGLLKSGLKAVSDPGYYAVLPAFVLISAGLALTFIQKRRSGQ